MFYILPFEQHFQNPVCILHLRVNLDPDQPNFKCPTAISGQWRLYWTSDTASKMKLCGLTGHIENLLV